MAVLYPADVIVPRRFSPASKSRASASGKYAEQAPAAAVEQSTTGTALGELRAVQIGPLSKSSTAPPNVEATLGHANGEAAPPAQ